MSTPGDATPSLADLATTIYGAPTNDPELWRVMVEQHALVLVEMTTLTITHVTPPAENLFGYIHGELIGRPLSTLIPEDRREIHNQHMRAFAEDPHTRSMGVHGMSLRGRKRNGETFAIGIELHPFYHRGRPYVSAVIAKMAPPSQESTAP